MSRRPTARLARLPLLVPLAVLLLAQAVAGPSRAQRECAMRAVVELIALREGTTGVFAPGTRVLASKSYVRGGRGGSGSIVDAGGLILTNAHVVASGTPASAAPLVEVRLTERPDQAARPAYLAEVVELDHHADLAVLRIVADISGNPVGKLSLQAVPLGSSDDLLPGDSISLLGYPAVGGQTITFTAGYVSGFVGDDYTGPGRRFIKTDAKLSVGASGGAAIDDQGRLVAIPTGLYFDRKGGAPQESQNYLRPLSLAVEMLARAGANLAAIR
ncbi:MAG TPA: serine protease [Deinococcales bacterium]|nr:serine protease [Deinococcales bacterium]